MPQGGYPIPPAELVVGPFGGELTDKDIELWKERRKLDRECSVEHEVDMLKECKFEIVKCVYSCQKFSVVVAVK